MKGFSKFFIILIVSFFAVSCAAPIGTLTGGSSSPIGSDALWAEPHRVLYNINNLFIRNSDLSVFSSYRGAVEVVSIDQVDIFLVEDPDYAPGTQVPVSRENNYLLDSVGKKHIIVKYRGMSTWYEIVVQDPYNTGENGGGGGGGEGGSGIIIEWP